MIDDFILEDDATKFDEFDEAIIGYTEDGRIVYDGDGDVIISLLAEESNYEDALDYYGYNVLRTLPYMGEHKPVIAYMAKWEDEDGQTATDSTGKA